MKVKIVLILMMLTVIFAYAKEPGNEQNIVMPLGDDEWPVAFISENNTDLALATSASEVKEEIKQGETKNTQPDAEINPEVNVQYHVEIGERVKPQTNRYIPPYYAKEEFLPFKFLYHVEVGDTAKTKAQTGSYIPPYYATEEFLPVKFLYHVEVGDTAKNKDCNYIPVNVAQTDNTSPVRFVYHVVFEDDKTTSESAPLISPKWFVAAKTNLLWLAGTIANLGVEAQFADRWSIDIPVYYSPYDIKDYRKLRVLATQPEVRYWFGDQAGEGHFMGLHGHIAGFNVAINDHGRYQDPERPMWGLGLGYGYAVNFGKGKHWGLEFNIGVGFANYEYDEFYNRLNGQLCDTGEDWYWGVTRAGITLTYKWWFPRKSKVKNAIVK